MDPMNVVALAVTALGPEWLDPQHIMTTFGDLAFWIVVGIIFAECGLLIGFFLPGDSLLFVLGLFIASGAISINIAVACVILVIAAIAGNLTGYWIGRKAGPAMFSKPDSKLFRQEYVEKTHQFFNRYGNRAIVQARFVPIVRTFITAVAGVGKMDFRNFAIYSAIGAVLWAAGITLLGYFLGGFPFVEKNLEIIILLIIFISVVPMIFEWIKHRREKRGIA